MARSVACLFAAFICSCGAAQTQVDKQLAAAHPDSRRFPFSLKEPAVYQATAVITTHGVEERFFIARKGERWRYDIYRGTEPVFSQLRNDKVYRVDHPTKTFREEPAGADPLMPSIGGSAMDLFRGRDHFDFQESGTDGNVTKFRATSEAAPGDVFIYFDNTAGMITKQEFMDPNGTAELIYELKDLSLDVRDSVFEIPAGYRRVAGAQTANGR